MMYLHRKQLRNVIHEAKWHCFGNNEEVFVIQKLSTSGYTYCNLSTLNHIANVMGESVYKILYSFNKCKYSNNVIRTTQNSRLKRHLMSTDISELLGGK